MDVNVAKNMKYIKIILILFIIVSLCACGNKYDLEREKYEFPNQITIKNLYGCWKYDTLEVYEVENLIYHNKYYGTINFNNENLKYCYYTNEEKIACDDFDFTVKDNTLLINEANDILYDKYYIDIDEVDDFIKLYMTTGIDDLKYVYTLSYTNDCTLD